jgi:hypothetical protein
MTSHNHNKKEVQEVLVCTWDINADCDNCTNGADLDCKWDMKHLINSPLDRKLAWYNHLCHILDFLFWILRDKSVVSSLSLLF